MMRAFIEVISSIALLFVILLLLFITAWGILLGINVVWNKYSCENYSNMTGVETKSGWGDCFLKIDGSWIRWEEYKIGVQTNQKIKLEAEVK